MLGGTLEIRAVPFGHADVQRLVEEVQAEYVVRYGGPDETPMHPHVFDPPDGAFFVGYVGEEPVATGGWRSREDVRPWGSRRAAEVKRMYVTAAARRRGYAQQVLTRLEESARERGADVMVLETGLAQPEAIAMYLRAGYREIDAFGYYADAPQSRYFGKPLLPDQETAASASSAES
jgi:ribosomal protein S18 acetylase RimI-like enzyme